MLRNLGDAVHKAVERHHAAIRQVASDMRDVNTPALPDVAAVKDTPEAKTPGPSRREVKYHEIEANGVLSIALANERPVIASALGCFADMLVDGVHGLLFSPGKVEALSLATARMIADRPFAARCGVQAHCLAEAVPGWNAIAMQTVALYEAV